jgi:hypothetical protein
MGCHAAETLLAGIEDETRVDVAIVVLRSALPEARAGRLEEQMVQFAALSEAHELARWATPTG